jgi:oligopeptide/dipeptide ABC transporter ATP-binding protein
LLAAVPIPEVRERGPRQLLKGEITSAVNPKNECRFVARCPYATEICKEEKPVLIEAMPQHFVACHHVLEINKL